MTQLPISNNDGNLLDDSASASEPKTILVGIDWADEKHAFELLSPDGQRHAGSLLQDPQAIAEWIAFWQKKCCSVRFHICIETSHGALVNALREHPQVTIYPVNPNALANYRKAFAHGGGKNDPVDAKLILQYLQHYRDQLRPLSCDLPLTRELDALCKDRRGLVQQRVDLANELSAVLKAYFPAVLRIKPSSLYAKFVIRLLQKYPTLELVQKAGRHKLRKHFFGYGTKARIEERIEILMTATPHCPAKKFCCDRVRVACRRSVGNSSLSTNPSADMTRRSSGWSRHMPIMWWWHPCLVPATRRKPESLRPWVTTARVMETHLRCKLPPASPR